MDIILVISMLAIFVFGFYTMNRLDRFASSGHFFPDAGPTHDFDGFDDVAAVFGKSPLAEGLEELLRKRNVKTVQIPDLSGFNQVSSFGYLLAVDESDLENLTACSVAEKMMGVTRRIALCSSPDNVKLYRDKRIPYLFKDEFTPEEMVNRLFPVLSQY